MKKKCLIIGGGSDIGRAIVNTLQNDYEIIWTYCSTIIDLPGKSMRCDLTDMEQIKELFSKIDKLDLLVTSAFPFMEYDNFDFDGYLKAETFLRGHVLAMTLAARKMTDGKIVNILGQCVERGLPGAAFYSAAFAFLHNFGSSINGREGKMGKVAVCDLLLGPVNTREWQGVSATVVERYMSKVRDFISPQQVANTVKFLASQRILPSTFKLDAYYGY